VSGPLLEVSGLTTEVAQRRRSVPLVQDLSFEVGRGETIAVVGESGSGKSMAMLSIMGLLPPAISVTAGSVRFGGVELLDADGAALRTRRGRELAMVYQSPLHSLNPMMRIGDQIAEAVTAHGGTREDGLARAREALGEVGIPRPDRAVRMYPHQLSGGMRQRVVIAMALVNDIRLLVADEPTTALDVTIQQQIVAVVTRLQRERDLAVIWITHDLGLVARIADRVLVMYAGRIVEQTDVHTLFAAPRHPYAASLVRSIPTGMTAADGPLAQIPGAPPEPADPPAGCAFAPRCPQVVARCREERPHLTGTAAHLAACHVPREEWS